MQRNGSGTSLPADTSLAGMSTNEASLTCPPAISGDIPNAISSPGSVDGPMLSGLPDGQTIVPSGQGLVPVSRFHPPLEVAAAASKATSISGQSGASLLLQRALATSLANRLPKPPLIGIPSSAMTWRELAMPSGRLTCRLAVSAKIMRAHGFILLATPTATANQSCPSMMKWPGCNGVEVSPEAWCKRMGYPIEWLHCAPSETQLFRKSRPNSSKR